MPDDAFGFPTTVPDTIWKDQFREAGGVNIADMLAQQQTARAAQQAQQQAYLEEQAAADAAEQQATQQQQFEEARTNFVDWPTFQRLAAEDPEARTQSRDAYDGYLAALGWQLQQMGYPPEEAQQAVAQFQQTVPRPARDDGLAGNLWDSLKGGFASGTRALEASKAATAGDVDELARLAVDSAGSDRNAALQRFQAAVSPGDGADSGWWDTIKRIGMAGVRDPEGMANFFAEQLTQSYPAMAAGAGGGLAGSLAGPLGTVAGVAAGTAAGSGALDVGSTILDGLVHEAQERGINPNDQKALVALLREPGVRQRIIQGGVDHGIPVALMDGATSALSFGIGGSVARSLRVGARGAATAKTAGGLLVEAGGGAAGEALGQINQFGQINDKTGVVLEALGELGPGIGSMVAGGVVDSMRTRPVAPAPAVPPGGEPDINESDLPSSGQPQLLLPSTPQPIFVDTAGIASADAAAVVRDAERRAADAARATNPLFAALDKYNPGWRDGTSEEVDATVEPPIDFDNADSLRAALQAQGVTFRGFLANNLIADIAATPMEDKRAAIADAIEGLQSEDIKDAEPMAMALLQLSRALPPEPAVNADDVVAARTVTPSQSLLETIRKATGQRNKADRSAETQAWVDHFLALPRDLAGEQLRRENIADVAWQQSEEAARVESMNELPNNGPVDQAQLDAAHEKLDWVVEQLGTRVPTSRAKLQKLRARAGQLMEETTNAYNQRNDELSDAGSGGAGAGRSGGNGAGAGTAGGLTRGGRSSTASAITPLQYRYLNEAGRGALDLSMGGRSAGERQIADILNIDAPDVVSTVAQALADELVLSVMPGVQNGQTRYRAAARTSAYNNPTLDRAAAAEARGLRRPRVADVQRRSLRSGEQIPSADIVAGFRGPVEAAGGAQETQGQPGGGVRVGVAQEGTVSGQSLRRGPGAVDLTGQAGVGEQPNNPQGNTGVPRLVQGRGYVQDDTNRGGRPLATPRQISADVRLIEAQLVKEDTLRRATEKQDAKTKSQKLSLKRAEREQRKALAILERTANEENGGTVSPEERIDALKNAYEKIYPSSNFDDDVSEIFDANAEGVDVSGADRMDVGPGRVDAPDGAPPASGAFLPPHATIGMRKAQQDALRGTTDEVLQYLAATMNTPLGRMVAGQLRRLNLQLPPITLDPMHDAAGSYYFKLGLAAGTNFIVNHSITINPVTGTLESVLHELVHAATLRLLTEPRTAAERMARKKLEALLAYVKTNAPDMVGTDVGYGLENIYEFVAEALSNPAFQTQLNKMRIPGTAQSVWSAFQQLVFELLGIKKSNTVLSEVLLTSSNLFSGDQISVKGRSIAIRENRAAASQVNVERAQNSGAPRTAIVGTQYSQRTHIAYATGDTFTLYPTSAEYPEGIPKAGITKLSRAQAEKMIREAGSEVVPPAADSRPASGTPKTTEKKLVGFAPDGTLQVAAFEQKDGTWTYYESDKDVRTDINAKVYKNLTKDQAQRYLNAKGVQPVAPKMGSVKPAGTSPTAIGYSPPRDWTVTWQNAKAAIQYSLGDSLEAANVPPHLRVDQASVLMNSRATEKIKQVNEQYVEPARKAGARITKDFSKSQEHIEETLRHLHQIERSRVKIAQLVRGNMDAATQAKKIQALQTAATKAQSALTALGNPQYLAAVKDQLAPKMKSLSDNTIDMAAQYGLIPRDAAENIKAAYDYYVPFQKGDYTATGKAATGASTTGDQTFARMQEQALRTILRGEQNNIRRMVKNLAEQYGIVNTKTNKGVVDILPGTRVYYDPDTNSLNEGADSHMFDDNAIVVYESGERSTMLVTDDAMLQALGPYKGEQRKTAVTALIAIASWVNHLISIGKTALSPAFAPFNFMRDMGTAMINMPKGVSRVRFMTELANPETYMSSMYNTFRDAFGADMQGKFSHASKVGAFISQRAYVGLDVLVRDMDAAFAPTVVQKLKRGSRGSFKILTATSQSFESFTRYAVYKAAKASGMTDDAAAVAAKTASVNFENRGLKNLSPIYIFANAKLQGLSALHRTMTKNTPATVVTGTMALVALGLIAGMTGYKLSEKDKDGKSKYAKIPDYKKDSLVVFKEGAPGVPMPQEVAPFYVLGNTLADLWYGGKTMGEAASRILTSTASMLPANVPQQEVAGHKARPAEFLLRAIVPSQFQPVVDIATNHNTFGSDVVSNLDKKKSQGMPGYAMGSASEPTLAVNAAKTLHDYTGIDAAPQQLRLLNNYFNPGAEGFAFFRDLAGGREEKYVGDVVNPLKRRFTPNATGFYDEDQFAALLANAAQAQYLAKTHGIDTLPIEQQALAKSASMLQRVQSDASTLFQNSKLMSREQLTARQERKRELLLDGIRRYNELRDRMPRN